MLSVQEQQVKLFFDHLSANYPQRYTGSHPFHEQLFRERMEQAVAGLNFTNKTILDIGAGTGALYDYLFTTQENFDYYACDLSEKMLAQSRIPESRRFIGTVKTANLSLEKFDYIFALGLTTYLAEEEMTILLATLPDKLAAGGRVIMSFTHAHSMQWRARSLLRPLFRRLGFGSFLISQPFEIKAYTPEQVRQMLPSVLQVDRTCWLSPTLPLLSRFFPRAGAMLARQLVPFGGNRIYSDFLVEVQIPRETA